MGVSVEQIPNAAIRSFFTVTRRETIFNINVGFGKIGTFKHGRLSRELPVTIGPETLTRIGAELIEGAEKDPLSREYILAHYAHGRMIAGLVGDSIAFWCRKFMLKADASLLVGDGDQGVLEGGTNIAYLKEAGDQVGGIFILRHTGPADSFDLKIVASGGKALESSRFRYVLASATDASNAVTTWEFKMRKCLVTRLTIHQELKPRWVSED